MNASFRPSRKLVAFALAGAVLLIIWRLAGWPAAVFAAALALGAVWFLRRRGWLRQNAKAAEKPQAGKSPEAKIRADVELADDATETADLAESMIRQGRYALLLRPQVAASLDDEQVRRAMDALDDGMALTPSGAVLLEPRAEYDEEGDRRKNRPQDRLVQVSAFFLDRYAVTNRQYYDFVAAGGYEQIALWDPVIWPAVLDFIDSTGEPGPRFWAKGRYPKDKADHPVVGVSWYEAAAYARWVGKRLLSDPEWIKAASWPVEAGGSRPLQRKYPWGEELDRRLANLWGSGVSDTAPVDAFEEGASIGGAYQMIGNVWEWTSSNFGAWDTVNRRLETDAPMKSVRGGAFDTYFDNQATSQFQSGDGLLARKHNIGFRCAIGVCDLTPLLGDNEIPIEDEQELQPAGVGGEAS